MSALNLNALSASLERCLASLYVIHGEETLLALEAADKIRLAARERGYLSREVFYAEAGFDWAALNNALSCASLFSELKLLEIRIPSGKPGIEGTAALLRLAQNLPKDTSVLIVLPKLERAAQQSKWFAALAKAGQIIEARLILRNELAAWIRQRLARQEQTVSDDALSFFADKVEGNLLAAKQEIDKLALLYPTGKLSFDNIRASVANVARFDVFDLAQAWMSSDGIRTMRIIDSLEAEGVAPVLLLWALSEDIRCLLRLRYALSAGRTLQNVARELRLWGAKQAVAEPALRRIGVRRLTNALITCARIDRQIKGVEIDDVWRSLRMLLADLAVK